MLNNSMELPMPHLLSARHFTCLGDDVAASVLDNFRANLSRLLETLKSNGVSHKEFAARLGVAPQKVSQWKGGVFPRPQQIDEIAKALGVSSEQLFRESVPKRAMDEKINLLGEEDKNWLRPLVAAGERTTWKHHAEPIANRLLRAGIVEADKDARRGDMTGFTITDAAWKRFLKDPSLVAPRQP